MKDDDVFYYMQTKKAFIQAFIMHEWSLLL